MGYLIVDFITQMRHLEKLLATDFQALSVILQRKAVLQAEKTAQFKVVEQLQYHDIMRQKMEHIRELMEEITGMRSPQEMKTLSSDLFKLTIALLRYIQIEYRETIGIGPQQNLSLAESGTTIAEGSPFDQQLQGLVKSLEQVYLNAAEENKHTVGKEQSDRIRQMLNSFSMKSERDIFYTLFKKSKTGTSAEAERDNPEGEIELF